MEAPPPKLYFVDLGYSVLEPDSSVLSFSQEIYLDNHIPPDTTSNLISCSLLKRKKKVNDKFIQCLQVSLFHFILLSLLSRKVWLCASYRMWIFMSHFVDIQESSVQKARGRQRKIQGIDTNIIHVCQCLQVHQLPTVHSMVLTAVCPPPLSRGGIFISGWSHIWQHEIHLTISCHHFVILALKIVQWDSVGQFFNSIWANIYLWNQFSCC